MDKVALLTYNITAGNAANESQDGSRVLMIQAP
jgi:hypothetical protein